MSDQNNIKIKNKAPTYFALIFVGTLLHIFFEFIFIYSKSKIMSYYNIISIVVFGTSAIIMRKKPNKQKPALFVCLLEATVFVTLATIVYGWDYGFENWLFAFVVLGIIIPFSKKEIFYILSIIQSIIYLLLYLGVQWKFQLSKLSFMNYMFILTNIVAVFFLIFFSERVLKLSKAIEMFFLQAEMSHMKQIANTDQLTGLLTRRRMTQILNKLNLTIKESETKFYIIFADIDDFKKINDTYGHTYGDEILIQVSETLSNELRSEDLIARWGGEEFLILLQKRKYSQQDLTDDKVFSILYRVKQKISERTITTENNEKIGVTVTFGGVCSQGYKDVYDMINDADKQMYLGKNSGKNRIMLKQ